MIVHALADITGNGAVHAFSATRLCGKFVQVVTPDTNASSIRIGGVEVSATVGLPIPKGWAGQLLPPIAELSEFYDLSQLYYYAANGDQMYVLYGG